MFTDSLFAEVRECMKTHEASRQTDKTAFRMIYFICGVHVLYVFQGFCRYCLTFTLGSFVDFQTKNLLKLGFPK